MKKLVKPNHHNLGKSIRMFGNDARLHNNGKIKISMYKYIAKLLTEILSGKNGAAKTLAARHLFDLKRIPRNYQKPLPNYCTI